MRAYSEYRYGGKAQLSKQQPDPLGDEKLRLEAYHPSIEDYLSTIKRITAGEIDQGSRGLLGSLEKYYYDSDVWRLLKEVAPGGATS